MRRPGGDGQDGKPATDAPDESAPERSDDRRPAADEPAGGLEQAAPTAEQLEALRKERDELRDALLRRRADFENYKKRVERDQRALADDVAADIFRRLVDTVDNLERALEAKGGEDALRHGVELTLRDLRATLEAHDVQPVDPQGERFDPLRHQALLHEHVPGYEEGTVAEVFRKGYMYKDRLLRPALVKVASGPAEGGETGDAGGGEGVH